MTVMRWSPLIAHESASLLSWSIAPHLCSHGPLRRRAVPFCCPYVKGIRALREASLLCRTQRNRSHDDECHRRARCS